MRTVAARAERRDKEILFGLQAIDRLFRDKPPSLFLFGGASDSKHNDAVDRYVRASYRSDASVAYDTGRKLEEEGGISRLTRA